MQQWTIPVTVTAPDGLGAEDIKSALREAVLSVEWRFEVVGPAFFATEPLRSLSDEEAEAFIMSMTPGDPVRQ